jgi:hypothetical protein
MLARSGYALSGALIGSTKKRKAPLRRGFSFHARNPVMQINDEVMLAHAIELRDEIASGRFDGERSRTLAKILGLWLEAAKTKVEAGKAADEATVKKIDKVYREIQRRFAAH